MRRLALALFFSFWATVALAQGCGPQNPNCIVPTAPPGTSNNQAASTAFVRGAISTNITGAGPFRFSTPRVVKDTDPLRAYCYKGDGLSHPLSTVTSCNGVNTTGYTLAQWQALLPAVPSLSNEVDWAALQSLINSATGPISVDIPSGTATLNNAITVCNESVALFGAGSVGNSGATTGTTLLNFTGARMASITVLAQLSQLAP
jgi:hypothetical protein